MNLEYFEIVLIYKMLLKRKDIFLVILCLLIYFLFKILFDRIDIYNYLFFIIVYVLYMENEFKILYIYIYEF